MPRLLLACFIILSLCATGLGAGANERLPAVNVPAPLKAWVPWVLHDHVERDCPFLGSGEARRCLWAGPLALDLGDVGGRFTVTLTAYSRGWVSLPGRDGQWPQDVLVNGEAAAVTARNGAPAIKIDAGHHEVSGRFVWPELPDSLRVAPEFGLLTLSVNGETRLGASVADSGELWLKPPVQTVAGDRLDLQVFRQLIDELPMTIITALELDVAGAVREVTLTGIMPEDSTAMRLDSAVPARLEADGTLRLQLRPGHWSLRLTTRQAQDVTRLALPAVAAPWPAEEIWTFAARPALRLVEVRGGIAIDPRQTTLPADWQELPAFRLAAGEALEFVVQRRGDPEPEPDQLALARQVWLDFDGRGYTIQDRLSGQITRQWRLEATPALELGRVLLNGEPQFITTVGAGRGVEVRRGAVDLIADSRHSGKVDVLPAIGWAHDINSLSATLHLPPGWRLWAVRGVDNVPDTWLHRWSLLDLFLVLIATVAAARLLKRRWALLLLLALVLIWHEPAAPRQIWLHLLAALALLHVLPEGRMRWCAVGYRNMTLVILSVISIGFMIDQIRVALYPQLARPYAIVGAEMPAPMPAPMTAASDAMVKGQAAEDMAPMAAESAMPEEALNEMSKHAELGSVMEKRMLGGSDSSYRSDKVEQIREYDPNAKIQTGPGLPAWQWSTVDLSWNGPVGQAQTIELTLLSPRINLLLAVARVALVAAMLIMFIRASGAGAGAWLARMRGGIPIVLALCCGLGIHQPTRAELPDQALLQELQQRLLRPPSCLPQCAELARLQVDLRDANLLLQLEVHATEAAAFPLPGRAEQWLPHSILIDGQPAPGTFRDAAGQLWLPLTAGVRNVALAGVTPSVASFQLSFPVRAQNLRVAASGWSVSGLRPDGSSEPQLVFTRLSEVAAGADSTLQARALPAFFRVERSLRLGLDWHADTVVYRLTPPDSAAALAIPLLPGEAVTTPDVRVEDGKVMLTMAAGAAHYAWSSVLEKTPALILTAPAASAWVETWRADISPLWHAEISGLNVVHHQTESGNWLPTWQPWAGESVTLSLTRPAGVDGQSITIDRSKLTVRPGRRALAVTAEFNLRSSQGGQHALRLPEGAILQTIAIDGVPQPIRQDGAQLTVPLVPGEQRFALTWQNDSGIGSRFETPHWSLGTASVNAAIQVELPADRWTLLVGGPRLGPAVLFWGVLLVLIGIALGLGRTRLTPLNTASWLLLAVGLTQVPIIYAFVVVAWLFALAWRGRLAPDLSRRAFNTVQIALALLTIVALSLLFAAIKHGLLGQPDMQIAGNGSTATLLNWYQDRVGTDYPIAWVVSVSIWFYRGLMLMWALWLAVALLNWLRWGWQCYTHQELWRRPPVISSMPVQAAGQIPPAV